MQRIGFLILAEEMLKRSGAKAVSVRCWDDRNEYEYILKKPSERRRDDNQKDNNFRSGSRC